MDDHVRRKKAARDNSQERQSSYIEVYSLKTSNVARYEVAKQESTASIQQHSKNPEVRSEPCTVWWIDNLMTLPAIPLLRFQRLYQMKQRPFLWFLTGPKATSGDGAGAGTRGAGGCPSELCVVHQRDVPGEMYRCFGHGTMPRVHESRKLQATRPPHRSCRQPGSIVGCLLHIPHDAVSAGLESPWYSWET